MDEEGGKRLEKIILKEVKIYYLNNKQLVDKL